MAPKITRKRFVQGSAAAGGLVVATSLAALAARTGDDERRPCAVGYGELHPTPEEGTGIEYLRLPRGFRYRVISRSGAPMSDDSPTPNVFDGMGAYEGPDGTTILIRNHENRSQDGEVPVVVPADLRYDPDDDVRGGNTKLVVDGERGLVESYAVLGGTHSNCAGGRTPWGTWITCEEVFTYGADGSSADDGVPHGYAFEVPADADAPVAPAPIRAAGRFQHEAVAWLDGVLYETEDRNNAAFYRFLPADPPRAFGDLAETDGTLQALVVSGQPNFDADEASVGVALDCEWVTIDDPDPSEDTVRAQAQDEGAAIFTRTEGICADDDRVYFNCTTGGPAGAGQVWEYEPRGADGGRLKLVYESTSTDHLDSPDNVVVVPATGDVFLMEDGSDSELYVRGVTRDGALYDFLGTLRNGTELCGGCFSPDGATFFVNQQGDRLSDDETVTEQSDATCALTYAIWGPFERRDCDAPPRS
jgi:secreted PhoX family phosphatase